jgi:hypothetical protein
MNLNKIKPSVNFNINKCDLSNIDALPIFVFKPKSHIDNTQKKKPLNAQKIDYYAEVWRLTEIAAPNIKNIHLRGALYHIDHKIPISFGFKNNIPAQIIGGIDNLRIITKRENFSKNYKLMPEYESILKNTFETE